MGAYISQETKSIKVFICLVYASEVNKIFGRRQEDKHFRTIKQILKHMWKRVSSLNQEAFRFDYSNHFPFKKNSVLSPLVNPVNFSASIERLRQREIKSLYYSFMGYT
jgi:hypothetical protein